MIKTALVAMTIVGCDCDAKLCEYIGETPAQWTSVADCEAAMKSQMLRQRNFDYPLVSGICRETPSAATALAAAPRVQPALAALPPELSHRPSVEIGAATTDAEAEAARPLAYERVLEDGRAVLYRTAKGYALVRTGLSRTATDAVGVARQSAGWLAERVQSGF